jgi:hypothetical protein
VPAPPSRIVTATIRSTPCKLYHSAADDVGSLPLGKGLFYLAVNSGAKGRQTADLILMRWTGDAHIPFVPATAEAPVDAAAAPNRHTPEA